MKNKIWEFVKSYWLTVVLFGAIIAWYFYMANFGGGSSYLFPEVEKIWDAFIEDWNNGVIQQNIISSFNLIIPSLIISVVISLVLGTVMGMNGWFRKAVHPVVYALSVVPAILMSPFALNLAPSLWSASLFLIVYGSIWGTLFATITGVMTIDKRYLDKADVLEMRGLEKLVKVILPAASPGIWAGFINSLRTTFVLLVYVEMYGSQFGLGYYVKKYNDFGIYQNTWSGFITMVIVLVIVMQIFEQLKNRMLRWTTDE